MINQQFEKHLDQFLPLDYTAEEMAYAERFTKVVPELDKKNLVNDIQSIYGKGEKSQEILKMPLLNFRLPTIKKVGGGSTDVGDVSWVCPTSQFYTCCYAAGSPGHAWQWVAQGKSSILHKGMLLAAKVLACTAMDFLTDPKLVEAAHKAWLEDLGGETYPNPLPKGYMPEIW